jgi:hypothetical protein
MNRNLHFPDSIVTYRQILNWKNQGNELCEEQRQKISDYLILKKQVEHKWSKEDKKRFLKAKKFLESQKSVINQVKEVEA